MEGERIEAFEQTELVQLKKIAKRVPQLRRLLEK